MESRDVEVFIIIQPPFLRFLRELVKVDLSHNEIVTISPRAFGGQRNLKQLKLEGNKIASVDASTFHGLRSLEVRAKCVGAGEKNRPQQPL